MKRKQTSGINIDPILEARYRDTFGKDVTERSKKDVPFFGFGKDRTDSQCRKIAKAFGISNRVSFKEKYWQASSCEGISKDGTKFDSLKSSSLIPLLCFYKVSTKHPIVIKGVRYTRSFFEVRNQVIGWPSNMDVVLTNGSGDILFIECKASEYLDKFVYKVPVSYMKPKISKVSTAIYNEANGKAFKLEKEGGEWIISNNEPDEEAHAEGLKQLISHYLGLVNYLGRDLNGYMIDECPEGDPRRLVYDRKYKKIHFMVVLYKYDDCEDSVAYLERYKEKVEALIKIFKQRPEGKGIDFLDPITYQDIFNDEANRDFLDEKVKQFYKL